MKGRLEDCTDARMGHIRSLLHSHTDADTDNTENDRDLVADPGIEEAQRAHHS